VNSTDRYSLADDTWLSSEPALPETVIENG
jgi:hypothetical protein